MSSRDNSRDYPIRTRRARPPSDDYTPYPDEADRDPPYPIASRRRQEPRGRDDDERSVRDVKSAGDDYMRSDRDKDTTKGRDTGSEKSRQRAASDASDQSVVGQYVRHRNGQVEFIPSEEHKLQRPSKDGSSRYSQPNDAAYRVRKPRGEPDDEDDRAAARSRPRRNYYDEDNAKSNGRRRPSPEEATAAAVASAGYAAANGRRRQLPRERANMDSDGFAGDPNPPRRWRRGSGHYDDLGYDSERPRPTRRAYDDEGHEDRISRDSYGRTAARRPRADSYAKRRYDDNDDDYHERRRRDDTGTLRRSKSDGRPSNDRDRDRHRTDKDRREKHGDDWTAQGLALFQTHAMPYIKREGGKLVKKQLESFLGGQR